jgi:hypothetical protein
MSSSVVVLLWFIELSLCAFYAGGVVIGWLEMARFANLLPASYVDWHQQMDAVFRRVAPITALPWLLSELLLAAATFHLRPAFYCIVAALVFTLLFLAVTGRYLVPINREIEGWSLQAVPPQWSQVMARWRMLHGVRGLLAWLAFSASLVGLLTQVVL